MKATLKLRLEINLLLLSLITTGHYDKSDLEDINYLELVTDFLKIEPNNKQFIDIVEEIIDEECAEILNKYYN